MLNRQNRWFSQTRISRPLPIVVFLLLSGTWACAQDPTSDDLRRKISEKAPVTIDESEEETADVASGESQISADPIEVAPGELVASRTFIQSRSSFGLGVATETLSATDLVGLVNETTGVTVWEGLEGSKLDWNISEIYQFQLMATPTLWFDLATISIKDSLIFGENELSLTIDDGSVQSFDGALITLKDFEVFGHSTTRFAENQQIASGLQGWLRPIGHGGQAADGSRLTLGFGPMVNQ